MIVARARLTAASYKTCSRTLARGDVKRVTQRGPLVGYFIGCPSCGFVASYLNDEVGFREERAGTEVRLAGIDHPPRCAGCRLELHVVADELFATEPG